MPVRPTRPSPPRINNNRLCPKANDILKQVQELRRRRGWKSSIRALNDEAVIKYYAEELAAGKTPKSGKPAAA